MKVTCAIIKQGDLILLTQRPPHKKQGGKWEFPGGKLDDNESIHDCIIREIKEELSINIKVINQLNSVFHDYADFQIELIPLISEISSGTIFLTEHTNLKWVLPSDINSSELCEADVKVLPQLIDYFN